MHQNKSFPLASQKSDNHEVTRGHVRSKFSQKLIIKIIKLNYNTSLTVDKICLRCLIYHQ